MATELSSIIVTTADVLKHINNEVLPQTFATSLNYIFAYTDEAISTILDSKKTLFVKSIWNKLISLLQEQHITCANKSPLSVKTKKTEVISEICLIGRFLTAPKENQVALNLDLFFSIKILQRSKSGACLLPIM